MNKLNEQRISKNELFSSEKKEIKTLGKILEIYEKMLEEENILDFSNIQLKTFNLLIRPQHFLSKALLIFFQNYF